MNNTTIDIELIKSKQRAINAMKKHESLLMNKALPVDMAIIARIAIESIDSNTWCDSKEIAIQFFTDIINNYIVD
jgi:hypothetical protein